MKTAAPEDLAVDASLVISPKKKKWRSRLTAAIKNENGCTG
jgi:hypothetical protein